MWLKFRSIADIFRLDPEFQKNEQIYEEIRKEIVGDAEASDEDEDDSEEEEEEDQNEGKQNDEF